MDDSFDPNDPGMVRALARKHWEALNVAVATKGNIHPATQLQMKFFDEYLPSLPPDLAKRVLEIYSEESAKYVTIAKAIEEQKMAAARHKKAASNRAGDGLTIGIAILVIVLLAATFYFIA